MGTPQLVIWNSPHVGPSPILWNQSRLPKELPGSLNLLVLLLSRQSARFTLPPSLSFVVISSEAKEGLFLSLPASPPVLSPLSTTAERFSCRTEAFIKLHTQKHPKGLFKPAILNHVFVCRERINAFKNTHTHKSARWPLCDNCSLNQSGRKTGPCCTRVGYIQFSGEHQAGGRDSVWQL